MLGMDLCPDWPALDWPLCNCSESVEEGHIAAVRNPPNQRGQMHLWWEVRHVLFILSLGSLVALSAQQSQLGMHLCTTGDVAITS